MAARICVFAVLIFTCAVQAAEKPTYLRTPVLRGVGSAGEVAITAEVLSAASLLLTATLDWRELPTTVTPACADGCWLVEAHCAGSETQSCEVVVTDHPSGRQSTGQLTVRNLAPATDVAQALALQAAYLLEKLRQAPESRPPPASPAASSPADRGLDEWDLSIGPSLLVSSGISAWGLENSLVLGLSRRTFVRVSAGYVGLLAAASATRLDYFHALPVTASFGIRGAWQRLTATASLGLLVMPVFASSAGVADSDLSVDGCVELGLRYQITDRLWVGALARPSYGSGDVTLGEAGSEPFTLARWAILSTLQIGMRL